MLLEEKRETNKHRHTALGFPQQCPITHLHKWLVEILPWKAAAALNLLDTPKAKLLHQNRSGFHVYLAAPTGKDSRTTYQIVVALD